MSRPKKLRFHERYPLERSPFAQRPTQKDVAKLLGLSRDDLRRYVNYKEQFVVRRQETKGKKVRDLAYPVANLRGIHEKIKFHLNKIIQPEYVFSPRKGKSQRDNAKFHLGQVQVLKLDIKQFYPSTNFSTIRNWFVQQLEMYPDVAGLIAHLVTVDRRASFGSPVTPVLCTLVHRPMFDAIHERCLRRGLKMSIWVDDITISGNFVPGELLREIREIVRKSGLRSHKIEYQATNRPVFITGVGVSKNTLVAPFTLHKRIQSAWDLVFSANATDEREDGANQLLSQLGFLRFLVGADSVQGRKAADQMNFVRQKRDKAQKIDAIAARSSETREVVDPSAPVPW